MKVVALLATTYVMLLFAHFSFIATTGWGVLFYFALFSVWCVWWIVLLVLLIMKIMAEVQR